MAAEERLTLTLDGHADLEDIVQQMDGTGIYGVETLLDLKVIIATALAKLLESVAPPGQPRPKDAEIQLFMAVSGIVSAAQDEGWVP